MKREECFWIWNHRQSLAWVLGPILMFCIGNTSSDIGSNRASPSTGAQSIHPSTILLCIRASSAIAHKLLMLIIHGVVNLETRPSGVLLLRSQYGRLGLGRRFAPMGR